MIHRIIDFSVRNKFLVLLLVGAAAVAGAMSLRDMPLDAIPDLSENQVIIYSRWDRSPDLVEAQITYPIVTAMLGAPHVRAVRGFSDFGYSFVYVIFEDSTDIYWARTRTLEYLSGVLSRLPQDAKTELGPDATGLGWVFQYALVDTSGQRSLADLRSYQDWYLKYYLKAIPGVSEVATIGGFGRQYQVNVDPNRLRNYGLSIQDDRRRGAWRQRRDGRPADRVRRHRVHGSRPRLRQVGGRLREHRRLRQRDRHPHPHPRHRPGGGRPRSAPRRVRPRRHGRGGVGHHRDAAGPERARRDRPGEGEDQADRTRPAQGRDDRPDLRPLGTDQARRLERHGNARRGHPHRRLHRPAVPAARPERDHPDHHDPGRRAGVVPAVPRARHHRQHHVARRHRHRDGRAGGRGDRGRRADAQEARGARQTGRSREPPRGGHRGRKGSGAGQLLRAAGHRRVVPPGADARGAGRPPLQAARLHQDAGDDGRRRPGHHARPGAAPRVHALQAVRLLPRVAVPRDQHGPRRPHSLRRQAPGQPVPHRPLRAGRPLVASVEVEHRRRHAGGVSRDRAGLHEPRLGVHAAARRGRAVLHADHDARNLHLRGAEADAGHRPDHQAVPGGRSRPREGGPRGHQHRPRAALDARNRHHAEAGVRVAARGHLVLRAGHPNG